MSSDNVKIIRDKIIKLQKKELINEFRFKKFIIKELSGIEYNDKHVNKFVNEIYHIINNLGQHRWVENDIMDTIEEQCFKLQLDFTTIYNKFIIMFEEKYLTPNKKFIGKIKLLLQELVSLVHDDELISILKECFTPKKYINYERIGYLLANILNDPFIYTTQKISQSCEGFTHYCKALKKIEISVERIESFGKVKEPARQAVMVRNIKNTVKNMEREVDYIVKELTEFLNKEASRAGASDSDRRVRFN